MKKQITRREVLYLSAGLLAGSAVPTLLADRKTLRPLIQHFQHLLPIPPVLTPIRRDATTDYYEVSQLESQLEILPGLCTTIWGYEGMFPGPTFHAWRGRRVVVQHTNRLAVPTVVHLHGGATPPDSDGFPTDMILPDQSRTYVYPNTQRAATLWYHDHVMDHTGRNMYMGLAGFYLLRDEEEASLRLPEGPYDVPLLIQDRLFASDGQFAYDTFRHLAAKGGIILVNGAPWPRMAVAARKYRFRILNGSNATPLRLALSSGQPLLQIATDGGLLPTPVSSPNIPLAMAERIEIVVDFSEYPVGTKIILQNLNNKEISGEFSDQIMRFDVVRTEKDDSLVPSRLSNFVRLNQSAAVQTREFIFSGNPSGLPPIVNWHINGKDFDPDIPIASPEYGNCEIWHVSNKKFLCLLGLVHPVHIHLVNFQILERNGGPPFPHERGWKDTVAVDKADDVKLLMRFDGYKGRYLMHCHNLEHEDHSMMARFDVV
jgi:FtsP/CotA-like multicopper oxidase with cupredoxin domain